MRLLTTALVCCAVLAACGGAPKESEADRAAWTDAVRLQDEGRYEDAIARYRSLSRSTESEALAAKAELEIGRIELAIAERDRALAKLAALPTQVDVRRPEDVRREIDAIAARFEETKFAEVVNERAEEAREDPERHEQLRALERGAVEELLGRGECTAALDLLRRIESKRTADDRRDVAEMLAEVRTTSEALADEILAQYEDRKGRDAAEAVAWLDERMPPFRGTRAYARLLATRLAAPPPPAGSAGDSDAAGNAEDGG